MDEREYMEKESTGETVPASQEQAPEAYVTRAEVVDMINESLSGLKVFIVESDITDAQNSVKAVVEHSKF